MIQRYISEISGPLMDRIDIHIDVPAVNYKEMRSGAEPEGSTKIRERVISARQTQVQRFASCGEKLYCNAQMTSRHLRAFRDLPADCERLLERAMTQQGLSARAQDRILKVARTIADLDSSASLDPNTWQRRFNTAVSIARTGPKDVHHQGTLKSTKVV